MRQKDISFAGADEENASLTNWETYMSKSILMVGAAALAMTAYASPAFAQNVDEEEAESRQDVITVTARKTAENIQETPVAVSVVTADTIDNLSLTDLSDISKLTAGLSFDNEFGRDSNRPVIRGQANILGASGVSYFIDGVRISGAITDYDLNDIERIEVVKGPQSALYGRNTYSGAINIITRTPQDEFSARASLDLAEHEILFGHLRGNLWILRAGRRAWAFDHDGLDEDRIADLCGFLGEGFSIAGKRIWAGFEPECLGG